MWQAAAPNLAAVTSREESAALSHLRELLARDISTAPIEELADGVREAELLFDKAQLWAGRLIAEMRSRGEPVPKSWAELAKLTDVPPTTLRNRVAAFEDNGGRA